ncbi:unnamed protein product [Urochloa humidicola]
MCYSGVAPGRIWEQPARSGIWPKAGAMAGGETDLCSCTGGGTYYSARAGRIPVPVPAGGSAPIPHGHGGRQAGEKRQ